MENKTKGMIKPVLVLVCICLVVTLALSGTYSVAAPIISENQQKSDDAARIEVLPEGDSFSEYDGKLTEDVVNCYAADNGAGVAVTSQYKGFGGAVTVMTGINAKGEVTGVKVTNHAETPGLGTKAADAGYLKQYQGLSEFAGGHIKNDMGVDAVTGATITSNAVYCSVCEAVEQFNKMGGVR